jgi:hypothetical protein
MKQKTGPYGDALLYYARARQPKKMKEVLDMLISLSLLHSAAYPPSSELDPRLKAFIEQPKETLTELSTSDLDAADQLSTNLSGYANLRKFYELRDLDVKQDGRRSSNSLSKGKRSSEENIDLEINRPHKRRRDAASCLLSVIKSASSSIHGGLYDPEVASTAVMRVENLMVLLGEALPFLRPNQQRTLNLPALYALLSAIEDLETVSPRIYTVAEDVLTQCLTNYGTGEAPSPRSLLRKSTSGLTASSAFSMVGSSMLNSMATDGTETSGSFVLTKGAGVKRAWDWRKGLPGDAKGATVLGILRDAIAMELAEAFARGEDGKG